MELITQSRTASPSAQTCPSCADELTNVQGIVTCTGCPWIQPR